MRLGRFFALRLGGFEIRGFVGVPGVKNWLVVPRTLRILPNLCGKGLCGCRPWEKMNGVWVREHSGGERCAACQPRHRGSIRGIDQQAISSGPRAGWTIECSRLRGCIRWSWRTRCVDSFSTSSSSRAKWSTTSAGVWAGTGILRNLRQTSQWEKLSLLRLGKCSVCSSHGFWRTQHVCLVPSMVRQPRTTTMACCSSGHCKPGMCEGWDAVDGIQDPWNIYYPA